MRIRTYKPEFFRHETLFDLEKATGLPIRVAWLGLISAADREGRFQWRPRALGVEILPYDQIDFAKVLEALVEAGMVVRYKVDGCGEFGAIPTFGNHQRPHKNEQPSSIPPPNQGVVVGTTKAVPEHDQIRNRDAQEGKGREQEQEGKGKDLPPVGPPSQGDASPAARTTKGKASRRCSPGFTPSFEAIRLAEDLRVDLDQELAKFRDYEFKTPRSDWQATFRNWLRQAAERKGGGKQQGFLTAAEKSVAAARRIVAAEDARPEEDWL